MLYYTLICFSIVCMAVMFCAIFRRGFEQTVPIAVILETLIVYAAGLVKLVRIGVYAACIISVICMLLSLFISIGNGDGSELISNIFSVGFAVFVILAVAIYVITSGMDPGNINIQSQTAELVQKLITDRSYAGTSPSPGSGIAMQPGYAVFIYMFTALKGTYSQADVLRGAYIFALSMILPLFGRIRWKNAYLAVPVAALLAGILYIGRSFVPVYGRAGSDAAAMLVFAMMLMTYMCCEQCGYVYWTLGFGNAMLILTRPGAEILVLLMAAIVVIDIAALGFFEVTELFATASKWISVIFCILLTITSYISWRLYAGSHGLGRLIDRLSVTPERGLAFGGRLGQVLRALFTGSAILPYFVWMIVFLGIGAGAAFLADGFWNRIRTGIQTVTVLLGLFIFIFAAAYAYTYIFHVAVNVKDTVDIFLTGYLIAALLFAVNLLKNKLLDRFFTA